MKEKKVKMKFTDFECNLLINGINEWRNMLLAVDYPTEDVDMLLLKLIKKADGKHRMTISRSSSIKYGRDLLS